MTTNIDINSMNGIELAEMEQARTRTYSWQEPLAGIKVGLKLSGLEYLQTLLRGELPPPPIASTLNMKLAEVEEGRAVFTVVPAEYHYNPIGMVHGGLACTLFDSALACAIHSTLPAGVSYTTLELKVNFVRPLTYNTGQVFCEGKVVHVGGRIATAEGRLFDAENKLYGHATTTCMLFR
jgi:uncharacterized protein (TIGR00369 family)